MSDWSDEATPQARPFLKSMALLVLLVFTFEVLSPGAQAIAQQVRSHNAAISAQANDQPSLGKALIEAKEHFRVLAGRPDALNRKPSIAERHSHKAALRTWRNNLTALDQSTRAEFDTTGRMIHDKNLPAQILQRHADAVAKYRREMDALKSDLDAAVDAQNEAITQARAESAFKRLDLTQLERRQQKFDPKHLPNSVLKADRTRHPRVTQKAFVAAGLIDQAPRVLFASLSPFNISNFPSAGDQAYLAATTEVVLTPDIVSQASALNGNPVQIYNWVRNNVQWQPTWGAIQDASHTLSSLRGNAFDIASLTIALFRASGIPARYVHGTINVPADVFRNWAGGFKSIEAALDFASAGGIPITAITSGGVITTVQMEHIWVEAAVDFVPSRGSVNKSADSWVALDPSFKQVQLLAGLDVATITGLNVAQVQSNFTSSGITNQTEGWGTGYSAAIPQAAQSQGLPALQSYLAANLPNATVGDVVGGRKIVPVSAPVLPASLPSHLVVVGARYATLPSQLEQQITFALSQDIDGTPLNPQTFPWAQLNNQQVTLSFRPTSAADQNVMMAFLPSGTITSPSQLPASIPAYLISVTPELKLNGHVLMTGTPMSLGQDLTFVFDPIFVSSGELPFSYTVAAGAYLALAVVGGSVSSLILDTAKSQLGNINAAVTANNLAAIDAITRETLLGNMFQEGMLGYFATYMAVGYVAGLKESGYHNLAAGLGSFGFEPNVNYVFGIPQSIGGGGAVMNVPIVNIVGSDSAQSTAKRDFTFKLGELSSLLESGIPEGFLRAATQNSEAVSAAKAFIDASAAGQRIYQITSANAGAVLPLINHDAATMAEISDAIAAGEVVITPTGSVSVPGWTGAGYVIYDPNTGSGAWKIAGGQNGAWLKFTMLGTGFLIAILLAIELAPLLALLVVSLDLAGMFLWINGVKNAKNQQEVDQAESGAMVVMAFDVLLAIPALLVIPEVVIAILFGMIFSNMIIAMLG